MPRGGCDAPIEMTRPFDSYVCSATLALSTVSSTLRVIYGASTSDVERDDREELLVVAGWLDLTVSIVTFVPIVVDAVEAIEGVVCSVSHRKNRCDDCYVVSEDNGVDALHSVEAVNESLSNDVELLPTSCGVAEKLTFIIGNLRFET